MVEAEEFLNSKGSIFHDDLWCLLSTVSFDANQSREYNEYEKVSCIQILKVELSKGHCVRYFEHRQINPLLRVLSKHQEEDGEIEIIYMPCCAWQENPQ